MELLFDSSAVECGRVLVFESRNIIAIPDVSSDYGGTTGLNVVVIGCGVAFFYFFPTTLRERRLTIGNYNEQNGRGEKKVYTTDRTRVRSVLRVRRRVNYY